MHGYMFIYIYICLAIYICIFINVYVYILYYIITVLVTPLKGTGQRLHRNVEELPFEPSPDARL